MLDKRIKVLDYSTEESKEISRKAGVAVMGEGIADLNPDVINYVGNAVKMNVWHGMMWKKVGDDAVDTPKKGMADKIRSQMYRYDLFEITSEEYGKHIKTGFGMRDDQLIRAGMPRNSLFFDSKRVAECQRKLTERIGDPQAKIICYLPTFRDSHSKPFSFTEITDPAFSAWLEENNIYMIQKAHFADADQMKGKSDRIITMNDIAAQELMAGSEMLVTDYSSCFFDFLLLDRPIIHYIYDYEYYRNKDRGIYYQQEEVVCGPTPRDEKELVKAIRESFGKAELHRALRQERIAKFMTYESPDNCRIITERILDEIGKRKDILKA